MKRAASFFFLLLCLGLLTSCMSPDDHDFFLKGWINPRDLDKAPTGTPALRPLPSDTQPGASAPVVTSSAPSSNLSNTQAAQDGWVPPPTAQ